MNTSINAKNDREYMRSQLSLPENGRHFLISVQSNEGRCHGAVCDIEYGMQSGFSGIYGVMSALDEMLSSSRVKKQRPSLPEGFSRRCVSSCSVHVRYCENGSWQGDVRSKRGLLHFRDEKELMQILMYEILTR